MGKYVPVLPDVVNFSCFPILTFHFHSEYNIQYAHVLNAIVNCSRSIKAIIECIILQK